VIYLETADAIGPARFRATSSPRRAGYRQCPLVEARMDLEEDLPRFLLPKPR